MQKLLEFPPRAFRLVIFSPLQTLPHSTAKPQHCVAAVDNFGGHSHGRIIGSELLCIDLVVVEKE